MRILNRQGCISLALLAASTGCGAAAEEETSSYRLGVLLPYTGDNAAAGASLERGVLMAHRSYASAGGAQIQLLFRDASDDPERAREGAEDLADEGVVAVIGPGSDSLAGPVLDVLSPRGIALLSPVATTARTDAFDENRPWLRVSVPGDILARSLANLMVVRKISSVKLVVATDVFNQEFADAFMERATKVGISVIAQHTVNERELSFGAVVGALTQEADSDGVMLAMNPLPAARLINDVAVTSKGQLNWFLSPYLKSDVFLQNTIPSALEGAVGVSPDTLLNQEEFGERFAHEWDGDSPLEGAHFSYDAAAVTLTAYDRLRQSRASTTASDASREIAETVFDLAAFGGSIVGWNDLGRAVDFNAAKRDWQFSGVTGPIVFAPDGARRSASIAAWTIADGKIVHLE